MSLPNPLVWTPWLSGVVAFVVVLALTPLVIRLAHRRNWLASPKADRWHRRPTALMGGIALYAGVGLALLPLAAGGDLPWAVWIGGTLLFVTGMIDDLRGLSPTLKLLAQIVAAGILLGAGQTFASVLPFWASVPLTFLWVIGITNAINLLDNMDGLAAGTAAIAAAGMAAIAALTGAPTAVALGLTVAGAALGFLLYNFNPARIFMGDSGSLFLGFVLAALAIDIQESAGALRLAGHYLVPLAVLAVPILDTTVVTLGRSLSGRSISTGGRDHVSHRLVLLGMSERRAVLTLYAISAVCGALALALVLWNPAVFAALLLFLVVGLTAFGIHLGDAEVYDDSDSGTARPVGKLERVVRLVRGVLGRNWKLIAGLIGDLLLVIGAFILAHELRFEAGLTPARQQSIRVLLPLVVIVKLPIFHFFGLYRGIWKHAGTPELVRAMAATGTSSLVLFAVMAAMYGYQAVSKGVAVIDAMIVLIAVSGVRFGFRGLRQYLYLQRRRGSRVLLYGAGDAGALALRELRQNEELGGYAVGFLDDDPTKRGNMVQGLKVLGDSTRLAEVCREWKVDAVLITCQDVTRAQEAGILRACEELGVDCLRFRVAFESLSATEGAGGAGADSALG